MSAPPTTLPAALVAVAAVAFALVSAGCGCPGGSESQSSSATCTTTSGAGTVRTPAAYPLPDGAFHVYEGRSCLATDGACSGRPGFLIGTTYASGAWAVSAAVSLRQASGAGSYDVVSPDVNVLAHLINHPVVTRLAPVGGRITVERSDTTRFLASFDLELQTPAGEVISLSGGTVDVGGCEVYTATTCSGGWGPGDGDLEH